MNKSWRIVASLAVAGVLAASVAAQQPAPGARQRRGGVATEMVAAPPTFADITKLTPGAKDGVTVATYEAAVVAALPTNPEPDAAAKFAAKARAYTSWGMIVGAVTPKPTPALDPATIKLTEAQYTAAVAVLSPARATMGPWKSGDTLLSAQAPDIAQKALEISAQVDVTGTDGLIVTQGGPLHGYALYLTSGKLAFAVRRDGELTTISAKDTLANGRYELVAKLLRGGAMALVVDGKEVARGKAAGLIDQQPAAGFAVGSGPFSNFGDYESPKPLQGTVTEVRVKTTAPSSDQAAPATGSDSGRNGITGTWKAEDVGFAPWTFTLKADGAKLTGTVSQGNSDGTSTTSLTDDTSISDGVIDGKKISFKCDAPGGQRTISFSGVKEGDTITFTREVKVGPGGSPGMNGIYGASGAAKFTAKRISDSTKPPQGTARPPSVRLPAPELPGGELPVPSIKEVARVGSGARPSPQNAVTATYILKTSPHATLGDGYVIVTDQTQPAFLKPLDRLAKFHRGSIIHVKDLGSLRADAAGRDQLASDLRRAKPHFVAVAPRQLTEKVLLGFWCVLAMLGDDQRLPVCPGILAAPNAAALEALVNRSIDYHPQADSELRPFVIGQVLSRAPSGQRSLQKVRMMCNLFAEYGCTTHSLVTLAHSAVSSGVTVAPANNQWQAAMSGAREFVKAVPAEARPALDAASLLLMFGHGSLAMLAAWTLEFAGDVKMIGKVVMCGDCFSAGGSGESGKPAFGAGREATVPSPEVENFALRTVENGAVVVYAHMMENAGFPHLFPVLEGWMDGLPVGEAYQRLLNALMEHVVGIVKP